jgi:hypothetical protein
MAELPGYDDWKLRTPEEDGENSFSDDPDCSCTTRRRDKWCRVHGLDPDDERDRLIEDREIFRDLGE